MDPTPPATGLSPLALTPNFYPGPGFVPQPLPFPVIAVSRDVYHPAWWYGIGDPPVGLPQPTPHVPLQAYPPRFAPRSSRMRRMEEPSLRLRMTKAARRLARPIKSRR